MEKLGLCSRDMASWSHKFSYKFKEKIATCKANIMKLRLSNSHADAALLKLQRDSLSNTLPQEERFWQQRAKKVWLQGGDTNSRFFHASASSRRPKMLLLNCRMRMATGFKI